ncbi:MAG: FmdE family protein [Candidatus Freyrarchaeum guaymaensis]
MSEEKEQETKVSSELLKRAIDFHGHLGPFLVIGLLMSNAAHRLLGEITSVKVKTRLRPPRSCVLDGVQVATRCTLGNAKLKAVDSQSEISAEFTRKDERKILVTCKGDFLDKLEKRLERKEKTLEEEALSLLEVDAKEIFDIK